MSSSFKNHTLSCSAVLHPHIIYIGEYPLPCKERSGITLDEARGDSPEKWVGVLDGTFRV